MNAILFSSSKISFDEYTAMGVRMQADHYNTQLNGKPVEQFLKQQECVVTLNSEEEECAIYLDQLPEVDCWCATSNGASSTPSGSKPPPKNSTGDIMEQ